MYHILIIEDDTDIRSELKLMLENALYQADGIEDFSHIPAQIDKLSPDLILLDIQLPGIDGLSLCREIRRTKNTPVIFVTSRSSSMDELNGIMMGGDDYITKPFNPMELLARVHSNLRRYTSYAPLATHTSKHLLTLGDITLNDEAKEVYVDDKLIKLTPIEYGILHLLMQHPGRVFSIEEIYGFVWNEPAYSPDTVTVHIRHIREKIEINPKEPKYLKVVWGIGYKFEQQN